MAHFLYDSCTNALQRLESRLLWNAAGLIPNSVGYGRQFAHCEVCRRVLKDIGRKLGSGLWSKDISALKTTLAESSVSSNQAVKDALSLAESSAGRGRRGRVLNSFLVGLLIDQESFLDGIRRLGILRPSRHEFDSSLASFVTSELLALRSELSLDPGAIAYLESISSLAAMAVEVKTERRQLTRDVFSKSPTIVKGLLSTLDLTFMQDLLTVPHPAMQSVGGFAQEELAEGFSFLFHSLMNARQVTDRTIQLLDTSQVESGECLSLLQRGASIRRYLEWELLVDWLDYEFDYDAARGRGRIRARNSDLEKCLRYGFVSQSLQAHISGFGDRAEGAASLDEFCAALHSVMVRRSLIELKETPRRRFVFNFPTVEGKLQELLCSDRLFAEEILALEFFGRDLMTDVATLVDFEIQEGITVRDLLKVHRLLSVFRRVSALHLTPFLENDLGLVAQSLLPVLNQDQLVDAFSSIVGQVKARKIVHLLEWRLSDEAVFDVQYQPLVRGGRHFLIPLNVFGASAIIRNSMQLVRRRIGDGQSEEALTSALSRVLSESSKCVAENVKYKWCGQKGEIDVLVLLDGILFAFECKQPLAPTGVHELRTTINHLRKAGVQLDRFRKLAGDIEFLRSIATRFEWDLTESTAVVTCCVNGNRMFSGGEVFGQPVRSLFEIIGYVSGELRIWKYKVGVRRKGPLRGGEFARYIESASVHRPIFEAMNEAIQTTKIGRCSIDYVQHALDLVQLLASFGIIVDRGELERHFSRSITSLNETRAELRANATGRASEVGR